MKWMVVLFYGVVSGLAGLGLLAFFNAVIFLWFATGPLIHIDLRHDYFLRSGLWFAGLLICVICVIWLSRWFCVYEGRFLTDE